MDVQDPVGRELFLCVETMFGLINPSEMLGMHIPQKSPTELLRTQKMEPFKK